MKEKFVVTMENPEYKTFEIEGEITDNGVEYGSPYTEKIEELQNEGWMISPCGIRRP